MKTIIFIGVLSLNLSMRSVCQNVYIPDANFKAALLNLGIDTNNDGYISFMEAAFPMTLNLT